MDVDLRSAETRAARRARSRRNVAMRRWVRRRRPDADARSPSLQASSAPPDPVATPPPALPPARHAAVAEAAARGCCTGMVFFCLFQVIARALSSFMGPFVSSIVAGGVASGLMSGASEATRAPAAPRPYTAPREPPRPRTQ